MQTRDSESDSRLLLQFTALAENQLYNTNFLSQHPSADTSPLVILAYGNDCEHFADVSEEVMER